MASVKIDTTVTLSGTAYKNTVTKTADGKIEKDPTLAAAKSGSLTVRTSVSVGTLTMTAGHGIITAARLDLYWVNADGTRGKRYGVVVGTVATNSVPITGGAGDDLPTQGLAITAMVPDTEEFMFTGNGVQALMASAPAGVDAMVVFANSNDSFSYAMKVSASDGAYSWYNGNGVTNPLAGQSITKAYFSHGDATAGVTRRVVGGVLFD